MLLGLDEPERSAVVLRYLEDADYEELAARQGISPAAARKRVSRGIERLRARLDERAGGRGSWALLAAPWIEGAAPSAAPSPVPAAPSAALAASRALPTLAMKTSTQFACALAVLAVAGASLWTWRERPSSQSLVGRAQVTDPRGGADALVDAAPSTERAQVEPTASTEAAASPAVLDAFPARPASTVGALELRARWSDGRPASGVGARVYAWDDPAPRLNVRLVHTDDEGRALVEQLAPGRVGVYLDRGQSSPSAVIVAGRVTVVEVQVPLGFEVKGRVLDPNGGPVVEAELVLSAYFNDGETMVVGRSGVDGHFVVRDVGEARSLSARAAGFAPAYSVTLPRRKPGEDLELDLTLRAGGAVLAGLVVDASGTPLRGARVSIKPARGATGTGQETLPRLELRSDEDGRFKVQDAGAGLVLLEVRSEVHIPWGERIALAPGGQADVVVELLEGATLTGSVQRSDGALAVGATVRVMTHLASSFPSEFEARVDATGQYVVRGLPDGKLELHADDPGYGRATGTVITLPRERSVWDATLVVQRTVVGRVVDERGGPLAGWMVGTQIQTDLWDRTAHCDAEGRFELHDVRPDADLLHVTTAHGYVVGSVARAPIGPGEVLVQVPDAAVPSSSVAVRVLRDGRAPEPAAAVGLHYVAGGGFKSGFTDASGDAELMGLRPGAAILSVSSDGAATVKQRVKLVSGRRVDLGTLALVHGGRIVVQLTLPDSIEPGAHFLHARIGTPDGIEIGRLQLARGLATSDPLPPGSYLVVVEGMGIETVERACVVVDGQSTSVDVAPALAGQAIIELRVGSLESHGLSARCSVISAGGSALPGAQDHYVLLEDGVGRLNVFGLPLGVSTVRVELRDGRTGEVEVEVRALGANAEHARASLTLD